MCFGGGGGGSQAVITMPDTGAYDRQAQVQMDLMRQQQEGTMMLKQLELNQALKGQERVLTETRDFKVERANDTAANAARMAALIGAPPPQPTAKPPVVGTDREGLVKPKGKRGLRIDRVDQGSSVSEASGAGLNITTV
jgi:hypothetical protein